MAIPAALVLNNDAPAARIDLAPPGARNWPHSRRATRSQRIGAGACTARRLPSASGARCRRRRARCALSDLTWVADGDGGRTARIEVRSPDAACASRRAAVAGDAIPISPCASPVRPPAPQVFGPVPGNAIAQDTERFGQFWSPVLAGDVATIEFHAGQVSSVDGADAHAAARRAPGRRQTRELKSLSAKTVTEIGRRRAATSTSRASRPPQRCTTRAKAVAQLLFVGDDGGSTCAPERCSTTCRRPTRRTCSPRRIA